MLTLLLEVWLLQHIWQHSSTRSHTDEDIICMQIELLGVTPPSKTWKPSYVLKFATVSNCKCSIGATNSGKLRLLVELGSLEEMRLQQKHPWVETRKCVTNRCASRNLNDIGKWDDDYFKHFNLNTKSVMAQHGLFHERALCGSGIRI